MTRNADFYRHARRVIVLRAVFLALLATGLAGCASQSPSVFRTAGASAHDIAVLTYTMFAILSAVLITVWSLLAWVLIRYRERPDREPSQTRGNTRIEIVWTVIPAIIVAVLFTLTMVTTGKLIDPAEPVQFTVTGHQWWWQVKYAGADFYTANEIHIPADTTVRADLLSADVIHGFWVPQLAGKVQLIPAPRQPHHHPAGRARYLPRACAPTSAARATPRCTSWSSCSRRRSSRPGSPTSSSRRRSPRERRPWPAPTPSPGCRARAATRSAARA